MIMTQWARPAHNVTLRVASDISLFEALAADSGAPKSSKSLAALTDPPTDPVLVARVLRHLAAMGTVREPGPDTFAPTPFALALVQEPFKDFAKFMFDYFTPALIATTDYIKQNGYKAPTSVLDTPW